MGIEGGLKNPNKNKDIDETMDILRNRLDDMNYNFRQLIENKEENLILDDNLKKIFEIDDVDNIDDITKLKILRLQSKEYLDTILKTKTFDSNWVTMYTYNKNTGNYDRNIENIDEAIAAIYIDGISESGYPFASQEFFDNFIKIRKEKEELDVYDAIKLAEKETWGWMEENDVLRWDNEEES